MKRNPDKRWWWIWLGAGALLIRFFIGFFPGIAETLYSRGIFPVIRYIFDYTICLLPLPLFYLLFFALVLIIIVYVKKMWINRKTGTLLSKLKSAGLSFGALGGGIVFMFLFLWGFNYARIPVEQQLVISPAPLDSFELKNEVDFFTEKAADFRRQIPEIKSTAINSGYLPENMELKVRQDLIALLQELGFPAPGRVRGRKLSPEGILMHFGVAGVYIPFIGEGNIDSGLHPVTHPYTMAHEMAHGYGFTDEGTCNFLAFLACSKSKDPVIRYAGYLAHSRDVLVAYRQVIGHKYPEFRKTLDPGLVADMDAINTTNSKFRDWVPTYRINNIYLKSQGIREGIMSYNRVVLMVRAYREKNLD